jgi:mRNA interferase MazF
MLEPGDVVLFKFPEADQSQGKLRPGLVLSETPDTYDDYLICMISSQTFQAIDGFDVIIKPGDSDFSRSGLRTESVIRISRIAVVNKEILKGKIGSISFETLEKILTNLSDWIKPENN